MDSHNFVQLINALVEDKEDKHVTLLLVDIDNSKKTFPEYETLPEVLPKFIKNFLVDTFKNVEVFQVGRDAYASIIWGEEVNVFKLGNIKNELQLTLSNEFNRNITFCMGVASYPSNIKYLDDLYPLATDALYEAKEVGTNSIELAQETNMKLKSIYLRRTQIKRLNHAAKLKQKPESVIIRKAIDQYLDDLFN